ncbi:peptidase [Syntrophotalea acetylenivorans]|uniref:Peptidase n=1 Tax=Syntrophotalea acetylenivorans TaxID=1842532 RepID=A0A1L3GRJ8_9BACT|nr:Do family serine endopeptidase [Syntrophotalea acetylenivorans]APG28564.1 peptidase [Syntrophotalea acetylenivorans]
MSIYRFVLLACLLAGVLLGGCREQRQEASIPVSVRDSKVAPPVEKPPKELLTTQRAFSEVSTKVTPAVVNIQAARVRRGPQLGPMFEDFFGELFKRHPQRQQQTKSLGSGVIISAAGFILTNEHVVKGAEEIKVKLADGRVFDGELIGTDPDTDVAVLKIKDSNELPVAVLGDSDALQVGQWALAIGNPFGLDSTLTVGVISATGRTDVGIEAFEDFIQTDASINPGNSGGPLLNIYGEVIGINTAIVASGQGIGFAIPINLARLIAGQLMEKGEVVRGYLGVGIQPLSPALAESFGLDRPTGALVNQVLAGSPASVAGLRRGDLLLTYNGREISGVRSLQLLVANTPAGGTAELGILRDGERMQLTVTIVSREEQAAANEATESGKIRDGRKTGLGLTVIPAEEGGVRIEAVDPEGASAKGGVRPGDLVLAINQYKITDLSSFERAVQGIKQAKYVRLLLKRGSATLYLAFPAS